MRCPFCKEDKDKVVDSRSSEGGRVVRRRRLCLSCRRRFTTYERVEEAVKLTVVKKDGSRIPYDRSKIIAGVQKACYKRPISMQKITDLAIEIEEEIINLKNISNTNSRKKELDQLLLFLGANPVEKIENAFREKFKSGVLEFLDLK